MAKAKEELIASERVHITTIALSYLDARRFGQRKAEGRMLHSVRVSGVFYLAGETELTVETELDEAELRQLEPLLELIQHRIVTEHRMALLGATEFQLPGLQSDQAG